MICSVKNGKSSENFQRLVSHTFISNLVDWEELKLTIRYGTIKMLMIPGSSRDYLVKKCFKWEVNTRYI